VIELLLEILFQLLFEVFLPLFFELLVELGLSKFRRTDTPPKLGAGVNTKVRTETSPLLAVLCFAIVGAFCALVSVEAIPHRLLPPPIFPGLSMVLSPLGAGLAMYAFGRWRILHGHSHSRLATFAGGTLFAFAFAATRYVLLRVAG
jgi:hypothetical protein